MAEHRQRDPEQQVHHPNLGDVEIDLARRRHSVVAEVLRFLTASINLGMNSR
jgi:hypothetical protein